MHTYLCKLSRHDEWYPVSASGPEEAAVDFSLMWIGPGLRPAWFGLVAAGLRERLMLIELAYHEDEFMVVPVWVREAQ